MLLISSKPMDPIYLDYNATTPIAPEVADAMTPYLREHFGNPSSGHAYGLTARRAVEHARGQVAAMLGCGPGEVVFTSGGSESNNLALKGVARRPGPAGRGHVITSAIEHPAVTAVCAYLERQGCRVSTLPVDRYGLVDPDEVSRAIEKETILITIMHANNEVGAVEPIEEIGETARESEILFHTDAAQSCGKIHVDVNQLNVDLLTIAGHKLYAPKGIGALYIKKGSRIDSFIHGAEQESGRRAGTENVPYMIGLGAACEIARKSLASYQKDIKLLRDRLHAEIEAGLGKDNVRLNGHPDQRLPNTLNISIRGVVGEDLLGLLPEIAASTGAACHAGSTEPSGVLLAMGLSRDWALGALRLTMGRWNTPEEIDTVSKLIVERAKPFIH